LGKKRRYLRKETDKSMEQLNLRVNALPIDFDRQFEQNMSRHQTYKAAYEATEQQHQHLTGHRRYSDHDSYRVSRSRRLKRKKR
jgi:hypothetical protein